MTRLADGSCVGGDRESGVHTLLWPTGGVGAGCCEHSQARRGGVLIWPDHGGLGETRQGLNWVWRKEHQFFLKQRGVGRNRGQVKPAGKGQSWEKQGCSVPGGDLGGMGFGGRSGIHFWRTQL